MTSVAALSDFALVDRYCAGDQLAATELYHKYAPRLRALAKSRCGRQFAGRFDPDDVVQAVFVALFSKLDYERGSLPDPGDLGGLLTALTVNKVKNMVEFHSAAKRAVRRTISTADDEGTGDHWGARSDDGLLQLVAQEYLARLDEEKRRVVTLRMAGHDIPDIADRLSRPQRTVERILHDFRACLVSSI